MLPPKLYAEFIKLPKTLNAYVFNNRRFDLQFKPNENILEVGCGTGESTRDLLNVIPPTFNEFIATDLCPDMIKQAALITNHPRVKFEQFDISLNCTNEDFLGRFDKIYSFCALHLVASNLQSQAFQNMYKLLKPQGCFACFFPMDAPPFKVYAELYKNPQWAQYMKHSGEYSCPYNDTVNGRLSILENNLVKNHFKIKILSMQELTHNFETFEEFLNTMRAINPFESRLPENVRSLYWEDSINLYNKFTDVTKTGLFHVNTIFVIATKV